VTTTHPDYYDDSQPYRETCVICGQFFEDGRRYNGSPIVIAWGYLCSDCYRAEYP